MFKSRLFAVLLLALAATAAALAWRWGHRLPPPTTPPPTAPAVAARSPTPVPAAYVSNDLCVQCHAKQAQEWATSHHFQAMAPATEATVRGNFADAHFEHAGVTTRFSQRDGKFVVHTDGPDGALADFPVAYTFGVDPLQQYLIALPGGRLQGLTIAWDSARQRWFHLYPNEETPPGDVLHWTGRYQNWNMMCAACHSTNVHKNYDPGTDRYDTTWSEINVSCQSCHGLGERHVAWAQAGRSGQTPPADDVYGLTMDLSCTSGMPARQCARREVDVCAACHARRVELTAAPIPGTPLYDNFLPTLLIPDLYYADGQQLGEVYEYGSYRQSRMYQMGVRCTDCHQPHSLKLRAEGDALCVRCHQPAPDTRRFPSLAAKAYDAPAHHFHKPDSPGARCVSCHMPAKDYMIVHSRRDHSIRIPRPDLTMKLGTPNACNSCHTDQTAEWAVAAVERWYGSNRTRPLHYGEVVAAGRDGRPDAEEGLAKLAKDPAQPAIVRATALDLLRRYGLRTIATSIGATQDADPAVRAAAVASLERLPPEQRVAPVAPLLTDPARAVRIEAARVLSSVPSGRLDAAQRRAYEAALAEFIAAQDISLDMPGAHLNLAVLDENQGQPARAEQEYRTALRLDPDFTPARLNWSQLLGRSARNADAERVLKEGIIRIPEQGELHYSLGLLLAEDPERLPEAAAALAKAADLMPARSRIRYNYALALQQLGRRTEAETALLQAQALDPGDADVVYALAVLYSQDQQWSRALSWAEKLGTLLPDDPQVQTFIADVGRRATARNGSTGLAPK